MILSIKGIKINSDNSFGLQEIKQEDIYSNVYSILAIDGSTTNTGLAIIREVDGALMYSISATRSKDESPVRFKLQLKNFVKQLLENNKTITTVVYEEPIIHNITSVPNLFMLRTFVEELIIENEPSFNYIKHIEIPNMRWKKLILEPDKVPSGTDNQKAAVKKKMVGYLPFLCDVTQDEIDAISIGYVTSKYINDSTKSLDDLKSKKKTRPFKYNIKFIGADSDDVAFMQINDVYNGPDKLLQKEIVFDTLDRKHNFDKMVYETMGDKDNIIILRFSSKHFGNIVLQHRIGELADEFEYIYAVIWRMSRKS